MTSRAFLLLGFLIVLLVSVSAAHAETIPSTSSTDTVNVTVEYQAVCGPPGCPWASSPTAACAAISGHTAPYDGVSKCVQTSPSYDWWSVAQRSSCPADYTLSGGSCTKTVYSCPSGYALSEDQQTCTKSVCKAGTKLDSGMYTDSDGNGITKRACLQGCWGDFKGTGPYAHYSFNSQEYSNVYIGDYIADGSECTQSTPTETEVTAPAEQTQPTDTPEYDCASQGMSSGTINSTVVCVPAGTSGAPPVTSPDKSTETNPDGTRTETSNRDTVDGDSVTRETTTTQYDANGNVISQSTSTTNASSGAFCEQNPESEVCKKSKISGGGTCDSPPVADGDVIQAAIVFQTWKTRCEAAKTNQALGEGSALQAELAGVGENAMTGDPFDRASITDTVDVSGKISQDKFLTGGCLPDKVITGLPMGKTITIPFSTYCPYIEYFGMAMIALAMLGAARITGVF